MTIQRGVCAALVTFFATSLWAQPVSVIYRNGLVTIQCDNAPLSSVFEQLEQQVGIELILEDAVKSKRLTANLVDVPVSMAVARLLEGVGVNYAVMMDPRDWGRVNKVFVGTGGGNAGRPLPPRAAPEPEPPEDNYDDFQNQDTSGDPGFNVPGDELPQEPQQDFGEFQNPPGSSPVPSYLPPTPSYPRSRFTPGLPNNSSQPGQSGTGTSGTTSPQNPPPATFPFMDPFGRPIPVPPELNPQQQQDQEQEPPPQQ
jgi:hypothetical protein